jgi:hypothetical protein
VATTARNRTASKKKAARPKAKSPATNRAKAKAKGVTPRGASSLKRTAAKAPKRRAAKPRGGSLESVAELLAPTATIYAQEELEILSRALKHPALGGAFVQRWSKRDRVGIPKRDLAAFKEAMAKVDVEARVRTVVRKLEKAWAMKLDPETIAGVREDIRAMYRGE